MDSMHDRLRQARLNAGFSSAAKAAAVFSSIKESTYRAYENGQNPFKEEHAIVFARRFKVSPDWLLYGKDGSEILSKMSENYDNLLQHAISEIDVTAGMGGGGVAIEENHTDSQGNTFSTDAVKDYWVLPQHILSNFSTKPNYIAAIQLKGDSMSPTLNNGEVAFIDTQHKIPTPDGIYALLDDFGGVVMKRLELISGGDFENLSMKIISDNPNHAVYERQVSELNVIGRYLGKFTSS